jgi:hypothetical protein
LSAPRSWAKPAALVDPAQFDALVWEALRFVPISPSALARNDPPLLTKS